MYCRYCGKDISHNAQTCPVCGEPTRARSPQHSERSWVVTILLCWFLGIFGFHSFYAGRPGVGLLQLFTLGGLCVWWFIDVIFILCMRYKDGEGRYITL